MTEAKVKGLSISNEEYRKMEGLSSTEIKRMATSMAHYKYYKDHPSDSDSPSLKIGRAYHKFCLEPDTFFDEFVVAPNVDRRTKEGKQTYAEFLENASGKEVLDLKDFEVINDMRTALYATPYAKKLIYGEHEKSFFWEEDGIKMKCRPDSYGKLGKHYICVDLKTCTCAETEKFMKDAVYKYSYDIQAAHYCEGLKANFGKDFMFIFIAQEKTPPYAVNILQADKYFMQSGYETRQGLLETYKDCVNRNEFPAYMGFSNEAQINSLGVPKWIADSLVLDEEE